MPKTVEVELTHDELRHIINDIIAYYWRLEDKGLADDSHGYNSRKELVEKLKQIESDNFPELTCCG